jgi:hypothetical protein
VRREFRSAWWAGSAAPVLPVLHPASDEDKAAAREHWARVYSGRERERQATAREQLRALRRRGELEEAG